MGKAAEDEETIRMVLWKGEYPEKACHQLFDPDVDPAGRAWLLFLSQCGEKSDSADERGR